MFFEKYRPNSFKEMVGRNEIINEIQELINKPVGIPHLMFFGNPGTGKTTMAHVIANTIFGDDVDFYFHKFNASSDRGIDIIRKDIINLAKIPPIGGKGYKIILMDEADYMTPDAQAAFRSITEVYHKTTRFIFTANYPYKIIPAMLSRFIQFEFAPIDIKPVAIYLKRIAKAEKLNVDDKYLISLAKKSGGDLRKACGLLEGNDKSSGSKIEKMTLKEIIKLSDNDKAMLSMSGDADMLFDSIWEKIKTEKAWKYIAPMADCQKKMNHSAHKTLFLSDLLINNLK